MVTCVQYLSVLSQGSNHINKHSGTSGHVSWDSRTLSCDINWKIFLGTWDKTIIVGGPLYGKCGLYSE